jgi:hypothetical protein
MGQLGHTFPAKWHFLTLSCPKSCKFYVQIICIKNSAGIMSPSDTTVFMNNNPTRLYEKSKQPSH